MTNHREQTITQLLERLPELTDPMCSGNGDGNNNLLLMPAAYTPSVKEIERLLRQMRDNHHQPLIHLKDGTKTSTRSCWWHLNERYLRVQETNAYQCPKCRMWSHNPTHRHRDKHHHNRTYNGKRALRLTYDNRVNPHHLEAGITWIAHNWQLQNEPQLPKLATAA